MRRFLSISETLDLIDIHVLFDTLYLEIMLLPLCNEFYQVGNFHRIDPTLRYHQSSIIVFVVLMQNVFIHFHLHVHVYLSLPKTFTSTSTVSYYTFAPSFLMTTQEPFVGRED